MLGLSPEGRGVPSHPKEFAMRVPRSRFVAWGGVLAVTYACVVLALSSFGCARGSGEQPVTALAAYEAVPSGTEEAVLGDAPNVPAPIHRDHATKVVVKLEVREVVKRLAD